MSLALAAGDLLFFAPWREEVFFVQQFYSPTDIPSDFILR